MEPLSAVYNLRICNRFFKFVTALPALGKSPDAPAVDGRHLNLLWAVPFIGILFSIAIMPLAAASFWHHHFGKVSAGWALRHCALRRDVRHLDGDLIHKQGRKI